MSTATRDPALVAAVKGVAPERLKDAGKSALRTAGVLTSPLRGLPDYLIIGAKRCGTTSMSNYLLGHPGVAPLFPRAQHIKGAHYFDRQFARGPAWYRSFFPIGSRRPRARRRLAGEASPYYLVHPYAAARAAGVVPHARIVLQVREPAGRAFSQYRDEVKVGNETLPFAAALAAETARMAPELARMGADEHYYSPVHEHLSYVEQSRYADALGRWLEHYPREQVLVVRSEDLFERPEPTFRTVTDFLGLAPHTPPGGFRRYNASPPARTEDPAVRDLRESLAPANAALAALLGWSRSW